MRVKCHIPEILPFSCFLTKSQMLPFTNSKMGAKEGGHGEEELH